MDLEMAWTITRKDLRTFRRRKSIFYGVAILPLILAVLLSGLIWWIMQPPAVISDATLTNLLSSLSFVFVIIASFISTGISSYSIVGEKVEKSLDPLLVSPASDDEILLGKYLAAFIPTIIAIYIALGIYLGLTDALTSGRLGYLFYPDSGMAIILILVAPLTALLSIGLNVLVSSKVNDVWTATQLGVLATLPFYAICVGSEIGAIPLNATNLLILAAVLLVAVVTLFYLSRAIFRREEILTKLK